MNKEWKVRWLAALRSGDYAQGQSCLHSQHDNRFCCLGVLADLLVKEGRGKWSASDTGRAVYVSFDGTSVQSLLPRHTLQIVQVSDFQQNQLARMNDGQRADGVVEVESKTFNEIADYIEGYM